LKDNWNRWDEAGLIPTESIPQGNDMRPVIYGMPRWCDMFTPRQLLGHLTLVEELNRLKPQLIDELGEDKGKAVITVESHDNIPKIQPKIPRTFAQVKFFRCIILKIKKSLSLQHLYVHGQVSRPQ